MPTLQLEMVHCFSRINHEPKNAAIFGGVFTKKITSLFNFNTMNYYKKQEQNKGIKVKIPFEIVALGTLILAIIISNLIDKLI